MRKKLKIIFYIVSFLFFYNWIIPSEINIDMFWIKIIYITFLIPYMIYESIQLKKDDKIKASPFFINRLYLAIIYSIVLLLLIIYFK
jgi:hypothetical protein